MPLPLVRISQRFPSSFLTLALTNLDPLFNSHRTMLSLYPGRDALHILWGPNALHQLSGAVTTPLFRHLGLSSWHSIDGAIVYMFKFGPGGHILAIALRLLLMAAIVFTLLKWYRSPERIRRKMLLEKQKVDDELLLV